MSGFSLARRGLKATKNAQVPIPLEKSELPASKKLIYFAAGNTLRSSTPATAASGNIELFSPPHVGQSCLACVLSLPARTLGAPGKGGAPYR